MLGDSSSGVKCHSHRGWSRAHLSSSLRVGIMGALPQGPDLITGMEEERHEWVILLSGPQRQGGHFSSLLCLHLTLLCSPNSLSLTEWPLACALFKSSQGSSSESYLPKVGVCQAPGDPAGGAGSLHCSKSWLQRAVCRGSPPLLPWLSSPSTGTHTPRGHTDPQESATGGAW